MPDTRDNVRIPRFPMFFLPFLLLAVCSAAGESPVKIEFLAWGHPVLDYTAHIIAKDSGGKETVLFTGSTGRTGSFTVTPSPGWPSGLALRFYALGGSEKDSLPRTLTLGSSLKNIRVSLIMLLPVTYTDRGLAWNEAPYAARYTVSVYTRKTAGRTTYMPYLAQWIASTDPVGDNRQFPETAAPEDLVNPIPVFTAGMDVPGFQWPESVPMENHYMVQVKGFREDGLEIASSRFMPWPQHSPVLKWNAGIYDREAHAYALTAIMMELNSANWSSLPLFPSTDSQLTDLRTMLERDWGITTAEDLVRNLTWLRNEGHSEIPRLMRTVAAALPQSPVWETAMKQGLNLRSIKRFYMFRRLQDLFDPRDLHAWDYGRGINLARWGYTLGLVSREEAWKWISLFQESLQSEYSSWPEYGFHYILGRYVWASGMGTEAEMTEKALSACRKAVDSVNSPWKAPWKEGAPVPGPEQFNLDFSRVLAASREERLLDWAMSTQKELAEKPEGLEETWKKAPAGWESVPQIIEIRLNVLEKVGPLMAALSETQRAVEAFPRYVPFRHMEARLWEKNGSQNQALASLKAVPAPDPFAPETAYLAGRLQYYLKEYQAAEKSLVQSLEADGLKAWYSLHLRYFLGMTRFEMKRYSEARDQLQAAWAGDRENPYYAYYLGVSKLFAGESDTEEIERLLLQADRSRELTVPAAIWNLLSERRGFSVQ